MLCFICQRCNIEVSFDDSLYDAPEELLCEDCYLEAHNSVED